jgi:putative FmdB family regulatory protein
MPEYDYRCADCKEDFTIERSMSDSSAVSCTKCGSKSANRVWNAVQVSGSSKGSSKPAQPSQAPKPMGGGGCCGGSCH